MLEIEDYAFPFGLCFSRPIMLKIMLAYCINAYPQVHFLKYLRNALSYGLETF